MAHTMFCDVCALPITGTHYTDDEVCGGSDDPGFYLHRECWAKGTVEERRSIYTAGRAAGERGRAHSFASIHERALKLHEELRQLAADTTHILFDGSGGGMWSRTTAAALFDASINTFWMAACAVEAGRENDR